LRKHYLLAGVGVAVIVAAAIVVVGMSSGGSDAAGTLAAPSTAGESLPPGHPPVDDKAGATPAPADGDASAQKIDDLRSASAAQPDDTDVLLQLGEAYFYAQRYQQAERTFRTVLDKDPGNATATVRLAMVWQADGDSQRAEDAIKTVLEQTPEHQEAHYSLAIVYFSQDSIDEAKAEWVAAAAIDPTTTIGRRSQSFVDLLEGKETAAPTDGG
jgi:cytochrome c-type biogenesis protein CcmH/NrfG